MYAKSQIVQYQVKQSDGTWIDAEMGQLEKGDIFRQLSPDRSKVRVMGAGRLEDTVAEQPCFKVGLDYKCSPADKELSEAEVLDLAHDAGLNPLRNADTCGVSALKRLLVLFRNKQL